MSLDSRYINEGLSSFGKVEKVMEKMVETINRQGEEIRELRRELDRRATSEQIKRTLDHVQEFSEVINLRLTRLEEATNLPDEEPFDSLNIGRLVLAQHEQITKIMQTLSQKVDAEVVVGALDTTTTQFRQEMRLLNESYASKELTEGLQHSNLELLEHVQQIERRMDLKVDKSEWSSLETTTSKLKGYSDWMERVNHRLEKAEHYLSAHSDALHENNNSSRTILDDIRDLHNALERKADQPYVQGLSDRIGACESGLETKLSKETGARLIGIQKHTENLLSSIQTELANLIEEHGELSRDTEDKWANLATREELSTKADSNLCETMWEDLRKELACKAWLNSFTDLERKFNFMNQKLKQQDGQIKVAIEFVDWFARRGQNYEHNLNVVENHLESLSRSSLRGARQY